MDFFITYLSYHFLGFFYCSIISGILLPAIYVSQHKLYLYIDALSVYILNKSFNAFIIGLEILPGSIDRFE